MSTKREISTKVANNAVHADESEGRTAINLENFDAFLMDLDSVVTETTTTHAHAWKAMFDAYFRERAARLGGAFKPFDPAHDYEQYIDGKPRPDGVADFLQSRGIYLRPGEENDLPSTETVCGLANRKNQHFLEAIRQHGVDVYQTSINFIKCVKSQGLRVAVVTSSRNCLEILEAAGVSDLFDVQIDGIIANEWMIDTKPSPGNYLEAARRLGVKPSRAVVIEDSLSGVQAGKAGHFGLVVGVSRNGQDAYLRQSGADIVVVDLSQLRLQNQIYATDAIAPLALENLAEIRARIQDRQLAVFLDYDETLTPIVARPGLAVMSEDMRVLLKALADSFILVVISGRERGEVERLVGLDSIIYAGCHGFDIAGPKGSKIRHEEGTGYVPIIAQVAGELHRHLASIEGVIVENKTYAVAVHFRMVKADDVCRVEHIVDKVLARHPLLRKTRGKKVFELRPNTPWDKGKAVLWLLDALGLDDTDVVPIYIGDDVTDRDAFQALHGKGISILVAEQPQPTCADYRLTGMGEVRPFLNELIASCQSDRTLKPTREIRCLS